VWGRWRAKRRERDPSDANEALRWALLAVLDRRHERAEALLTRAAELDSDSFEPYLALARFYRGRGEIGRAIHVHQNLLLRDDLDAEQTTAVLADLAADFRQGGFLRRAIASYEEVLGRAPKHPEALRALTQLAADVRDYPRALAMQRRLAKLEKRDASGDEARIWVDMAESEAAAGRHDEARHAVKKALRANPRSVRAWLVQGSLEAERGKSKAALVAWSKVPELDRRSGALVYPQLESAYAALDRPRDFEAHLRRLLEEQPDDSQARLALARTLASRGDSEEALAELRRLLEREPEHLEARAELGRLLIAERRDAELGKEHAELLDVLERRGLLRARASGTWELS